ncbi:MAG: anti-sigma regulatory factor [Cyanobacteria bacterium J06598_3]
MFERDRLTVTSHLEKLSVVQQWFRLFMSRLAVDHPWINDQFDQLNLALAEGFTNAVRHAHANLPDTTPIDIELSLESEKIEICIFDRGGPFDPSSLREPQPGALREGGYGWFLLRRLADKVTYDRAEVALPDTLPGNKLDTLSEHLSEQLLETSPDSLPSGQRDTSLIANLSPASLAGRLAASSEKTSIQPENPAPSAQRQRNCLRIVKNSKIV